MNYLSSSYTDIGIKKQTNQDSLIIKVAKTSQHNVCLAAVCDGMGGLAKGELASATLIRAIDNWFINELSKNINDDNYENIKKQINSFILSENGKIDNYGKKIGATLGTTLTMILLIDDRYLIVNVGDSRVYQITEKIEQLTKDQTLVARDVERGIITPEQALNDSRRNVLLQCIGASRIVNPEIIEGFASANTIFLICSDGFRHEISHDEMVIALSPNKFTNEKQMTLATAELVNLCKKRNETDNISAILIKTL